MEIICRRNKIRDRLQTDTEGRKGSWSGLEQILGRSVPDQVLRLAQPLLPWRPGEPLTLSGPPGPTLQYGEACKRQFRPCAQHTVSPQQTEFSIGEATEAQRGYVVCQRAHSKSAQKQGRNVSKAPGK